MGQHIGNSSPPQLKWTLAIGLHQALNPTGSMALGQLQLAYYGIKCPIIDIKGNTINKCPEEISMALCPCQHFSSLRVACGALLVQIRDPQHRSL